MLIGYVANKKLGFINLRSRHILSPKLTVIAPENGPSQPPKGKKTNRLLTVPSIFRCVLMLVSGKTADSTGFFYQGGQIQRVFLPLKNGATRASLLSSGFVLDLVQDIRGVNDQAMGTCCWPALGTAGDFLLL